MFQMFPLLAISLAVYTVLTITGVGSSADVLWHQMALIDLPMYSGDIWRVTWGTAFSVSYTHLTLPTIYSV